MNIISLVNNIARALQGYSVFSQIVVVSTLLTFLLPFVFLAIFIARGLLKVGLKVASIFSSKNAEGESGGKKKGTALSPENSAGKETLIKPLQSVNKSAKAKTIGELMKETRDLGKSAAMASDEKAQEDPHFLVALKGHGGMVHSVKWSPDGKSVVTACDDGRARRYDLTDLVSDTARFLRSTCTDASSGKRHVFSLASCAERKVIANLKGAVGGLGSSTQIIALQHDGVSSSSIVCLSGNQNKTTWEATNVFANSKELGRFLLGGHPLEGDVQGQAVVVAGSNGTKISVFHATSGKELATVDTSQVVNNYLTITRDGRFFAAGAWTSDVKVYENKFHVEHGGVGSARYVGTQKAFDLSGHKQGINCVAFSFETPQPKRAVTVCKDGSIGLWNTEIRYHMKEDAKMIKQGMTELPNRKPYSLVAISPGPSYVIAAACESTIHFFDTNLKLIGTIPFAAVKLTDMTFCPERDGEGRCILATAGTDKRARLWLAGM